MSFDLSDDTINNIREDDKEATANFLRNSLISYKVSFTRSENSPDVVIATMIRNNQIVSVYQLPYPLPYIPIMTSSSYKKKYELPEKPTNLIELDYDKLKELICD